VQIRTIAMDYWASLEHQLKYKNEVTGQDKIVADLTECAAIINNIENRMIEIRKDIESTSSILSEDEILYQKLSRLDINV